MEKSLLFLRKRGRNPFWFPQRRNKVIWKAWVPPKVKFSAWLAIQNRVWTADQLERRGWQNCGLCTLCMREYESAALLFFKCPSFHNADLTDDQDLVEAQGRPTPPNGYLSSFYW